MTDWRELMNERLARHGLMGENASETSEEGRLSLLVRHVLENLCRLSEFQEVFGKVNSELLVQGNGLIQGDGWSSLSLRGLDESVSEVIRTVGYDCALFVGMRSDADIVMAHVTAFQPPNDSLNWGEEPEPFVQFASVVLTHEHDAEVVANLVGQTVVDLVVQRLMEKEIKRIAEAQEKSDSFSLKVKDMVRNFGREDDLEVLNFRPSKALRRRTKK